MPWGSSPGTVGGSFVLAAAKVARVTRRPTDHIFNFRLLADLAKSCEVGKLAKFYYLIVTASYIATYIQFIIILLL